MKWKLYGAIAVALLLLGAGARIWWKNYTADLIRQGEQKEQVRQLELNAPIIRQRDSLLAIEVAARTDTFIKWKDRWRDSIVTRSFTDTLVHVDTVRHIIHVADSTISACDAALSACNLRVQGLLELVANRDSVLTIMREAKRVKPSRFGVYVGAGSCAAYDFQTVRPAVCAGVSVGFRVW